LLFALGLFCFLPWGFLGLGFLALWLGLWLGSFALGFLAWEDFGREKIC
jgi:hypothetical protein